MVYREEKIFIYYSQREGKEKSILEKGDGWKPPRKEKG
jgi:hypothetical protein